MFWLSCCLLVITSFVNGHKQNVIEYCSFGNNVTVDIYANETLQEKLTFKPDTICNDFSDDIDIVAVNDYQDYKCTPTVRELYLGIAIGSHLYNNIVVDGPKDYNNIGAESAAALKYIHEYIHQANIVYINQFNIKLVIRHVMISTDEYTSWDNFRCRNSIYRQFAFFQRFPKSEQFFWHLIDACYKSNSAIGVANVGTSCHQDNAPSITHVSENNPRAFLTTIHELGHSLGALHHYDNPGIMGGYKVPKIYLGKYQFHNHSRESICQTLNNILETCPNKKGPTSNNAICGNGIIELGEECEGSAGSVCCKDCQLKQGAQCDPAHPIEGVCCDNTCQLKDYTQECHILGHLGYCRNGYCNILNTSCNTIDNCKIFCTRDNTTTFIEDNTLCAKGGGICLNGTCTVPTVPTEQPTTVPTKPCDIIAENIKYMDNDIIRVKQKEFEISCNLKKQLTLYFPKRNTLILSSPEIPEVIYLNKGITSLNKTNCCCGIEIQSQTKYKNFEIGAIITFKETIRVQSLKQKSNYFSII